MAKGIVPPPPSPLPDINQHTLLPGTELHRVHREHFAADQFNPGLGHARFSPFNGPDGLPVPTLYAALSLEGALMETVFHDIALGPGDKTLDQRKLKGQVHSRLRVNQPVILADLSHIGLLKMRLSRDQMIDTEADQYPLTQAWARALHARYPDIKGLSWVSRQDDTCRAYVFFGDRLPHATLQILSTPEPLLKGHNIIPATINLAEAIGVEIVKT